MRPYLLVAGLVLTAAILACAYAAAGQAAEPATPAAAPAGATRLVEEPRIVADAAKQIYQFVATPKAVYISFRYDGPLVDNPAARAKVPVMMHEQRWALGAWTPDGRELWRQDYPFANQLAAAGDEIALTHDPGNGYANSDTGIIWASAATGKEVARAKLNGRPAAIRYDAAAQRLIVIVMTLPRIERDPHPQMEIVAYESPGKVAWQWKCEGSGLFFLRCDEKALVVATQAPKDPVVVRLDPKTGRELWRVPEQHAEPLVPTTDKNLPASHTSLVLGWARGGARFLDLESGKTVLDLPLADVGRSTVWVLQAHGDRLYATSDDLKGATMMAWQFPSGRRLWTDETATVSYGSPVAWQDDVVFLARRMTEGLGGRVSLTELRVYGPDGKLRAHVPSDAERAGEAAINDTLPPQVVGSTLFVGAMNGVRVFRWAPAPPNGR